MGKLALNVAFNLSIWVKIYECHCSQIVGHSQWVTRSGTNISFDIGKAYDESWQFAEERQYRSKQHGDKGCYKNDSEMAKTGIEEENDSPVLSRKAVQGQFRRGGVHNQHLVFPRQDEPAAVGKLHGGEGRHCRPDARACGQLLRSRPRQFDLPWMDRHVLQEI